MKRPSHATIVAYLALFTALGGTAYAAATIGSREIRNNSIHSRDIRNQTLSSRDINERSLRTSPRLYQKSSIVRFPPGANRTGAIAFCERGDLAVSGATNVGLANPVRVWNDGPMPKLTGWAADFERLGTGASDQSLEVTVVCARKAPK